VPEEALPVYTLGTSPAEQERLRRQSQDLRAWTLALLDRVELPVGGRVIDLGCGVGGVLDVLSERVGRSGRVVGLEYDSAHVASARAHPRLRRLNGGRVAGNPRCRLWTTDRGVDMKRNLTVQLDDEVIRRAKVLAAKRGTSVSGLVAQELDRLVAEDERYEAAWRLARKAMGDATPRGGRSWGRDELHER
jgi:SAM-dependent methyltransferase